MTLAMALSLVAAIGGPAGLVALIMVLPQIKKLQADTARVEKDSDLADIEGAAKLSEAALAQMQAAVDRAIRAEERAQRADERATRLENRVACMERELHVYRDLAQDHAIWDFQRILELRELGVENIPQAPALLPPPHERIAPHNA